MKNVQKLIDQTLSYALESASDGDKDMAKCYMDDLFEFKDVKYLIESGYTNAAAKQLNDMDTLPLEQFAMALNADGYDLADFDLQMA